MPSSPGKGLADRREITAELNRLMAEEVEACLRYFHMRFRLRGKDLRAAERFLDEAIVETMEHASAIARQIQALREIPTLQVTLALAGGPMGLKAALAEALDVEQQALDAYRDLLPRVSDKPALDAFIRQQVEVEAEHVQGIRDFVRAASAVKLLEKKRDR